MLLLVATAVCGLQNQYSFIAEANMKKFTTARNYRLCTELFPDTGVVFIPSWQSGEPGTWRKIKLLFPSLSPNPVPPPSVPILMDKRPFHRSGPSYVQSGPNPVAHNSPHLSSPCPESSLTRQPTAVLFFLTLQLQSVQKPSLAPYCLPN